MVKYSWKWILFLKSAWKMLSHEVYLALIFLCLNYSNPRGMPWMGWFFMTLFLVILESSWVVHFWVFFYKFPNKFYVNNFFHIQSKGGPFYTSKNAFFIVPFLVSKIVPINLLLQKLGAKVIYFCQNMQFHKVLIVLKAFNRGGIVLIPPPCDNVLPKAHAE